MRFLLTTEQRAFADSLAALLTAADTPSVARDWSRGDHTSGRALWSRIAETGVFALAVPETYEGMGLRPVELALAFVELGRHATPGPLVETVAAAALLTELDDAGPAKRLLPALSSGESAATLAQGAYALDADVTDVRLRVSGPGGREDPEGPKGPAVPKGPAEPAGPGEPTVPTVPAEPTRATAPPEAAHRPPTDPNTDPHPSPPTDPNTDPRTGPPPGPRGGGGGPAPAAELCLAPAAALRLVPAAGPLRPSLDPARRLFRVPPGGELLAVGPQVTAAAAHALALARLTTAAQALGVGLALLDKAVSYVKQRTQFGVPIGSFQAVKHRLADARLALEFARPLVLGAALTMAERDIAAAKVTACEAAYTTARTALQLHGAIGYTAEHDLSLWLTKARALRTAWGSPADCRAVVLKCGDRRG
jgi:alkylation response protein AidB-like acyl-CoA dehydrogenase